MIKYLLRLGLEFKEQRHQNFGVFFIYYNRNNYIS